MATYDRVSRRSEEAGLRALRRGLVGNAAGRVPEIGAGTGANLPHYNDSIDSLVVTDPEPGMLRVLQRAVREQAPVRTWCRGLPKVFRSRTPRSTLSSPRSSSVASRTSAAYCVRCDASSAGRPPPVSGTCEQATRGSRAFRIGSTG